MEQFVRFELTDKSIRYGVLDLIVQFPTGEDVLVVICSSFSLWFRKTSNNLSQSGLKVLPSHLLCKS